MSIYDFAQDVRGSRPRQSRLVVDDDFSWSDLPRRRRAVVAEREPDRREPRAVYGRRTDYEDPDRYDERERDEQRERYDEHGVRSAHDEYEDPYQSQLVADFDFDRERYELEDLRGGDEAVADAQPGGIELAAPGRRTIVITGHGAERNLPVRRRRDEAVPFHQRSGFKPDRIALWAFLLAIALLLGATTSSHAAVLAFAH